MNILKLKSLIIDEIDVNNGMTKEEIKQAFKDYLKEFDFEAILLDLEMDQELRLLPLDKNLGTYYYQLPA